MRLRVKIKLPYPSDIVAGSRGWYAKLSLRNRANKLQGDGRVSKYSDAEVEQTFHFEDESFASASHPDFAVALYVEFFRYSFLGDERLDCRHYPLVVDLFEAADGVKKHETSIKDKSSESDRKFRVQVETEWERTEEEIEAEASEDKDGEEDGEQDGEQKEMWSHLGGDLKALGADEQEVKHIVKLARRLYLRREEFKLHEMTAPSYTDAYKLVCFSRGFGAEAYDELINNSRWRLEENCEAIRATCLEDVVGCSIHEFEEHYQGGFLGVSEDGSPIVVRKYGSLDLKALGAAAGKSHGVKKSATEYFGDSHIWEMEWYHDIMRTQSFKKGKIVKGFVVLDLNGIGMKQLGKETMKSIKKLLADDSDNYPDSLRKLFILNAPGFFSFIWRVIRPWLHPVVLAKIEITQKGKVMDALNEAGAARCCKSKAYGGTAVPIKGLTNRACFLPFGGAQGAAPNRADQWGADALIKICEEADGIKSGKRGVRGGADVGASALGETAVQGAGVGARREYVGGGNYNPKKEFSVMKKDDEQDLAEILKLLVMMVGISLLAVATGIVQRTCFGN